MLQIRQLGTSPVKGDPGFLGSQLLIGARATGAAQRFSQTSTAAEVPGFSPAAHRPAELR
jgi:hypothetical protein